jgi:hypothetical protein
MITIVGEKNMCVLGEREPKGLAIETAGAS